MIKSRVGEQISDAINTLTLNPKEVAEYLVHDHRTLQQNFMDICIEFIRKCADDEYGYDDRNFEAHKKAVDISTAYYEYINKEL